MLRISVKKINGGHRVFQNVGVQYGIIRWVWPPHSNSHHQGYHVFSRGSVSTFICHCYWEGATHGHPQIIQDFYRPKNTLGALPTTFPLVFFKRVFEKKTTLKDEKPYHRCPDSWVPIVSNSHHFLIFFVGILNMSSW